MKVFLSILSVVALCTASPLLNETEVGAGCTINNYNQVANVIKSCKQIVVGSFAMPAGVTLDLNLQQGTVLTFNGEIAFAYKEWDGPFIFIRGVGITVQGSNSHLINGRGNLWWDGQGDHGKKKPRLMNIQTSGNSVLKNIKIKDCPHACVGIMNSQDLTLQNWNIDNKDGDGHGALNTDGIDLVRSNRVTVKDSIIWNQDDCIGILQGQDLLFENLQCTGSHGLSIAAGLYQNYADNTVHNVTFKNSEVRNSMNGIHIKTIPGNQRGEVSSVTYSNIRFTGVFGYGIYINQDYQYGNSSNVAKGNVLIKDILLTNIYGTVNGQFATAVKIVCGSGGCSNWNFSGINIQGSKQPNQCNYRPNGFNC